MNEEMCRQHAESLSRAHTKLDTILVVLRGDDEGKHSGLVSRVRVLEGVWGAVKRVLWIIAGTAFTALTMIALYWTLFRVKPPM